MRLVFLTPAAALVGLAALVPVAAWLLGERRVRRARAVLRLSAPGRGTWWAPAAIAAALALVALAAAQPVLSSTGGRTTERRGEVFVVVDTSESMRAGSPTRFRRAVAAAERIRDALRGTPVGLASVTDRVLPHIFPTVDREDYMATLHRAIAIDRPPPARTRRQASGFDALAVLGGARFYSSASGPRVAVVLTDGESRPFDVRGVARSLRRAGVRVVIVRFWRGDERIAGDSVYHADPSSESLTQALASRLGGDAFDENRLGEAIAAVRRDLGTTAAVRPPRAAATARPLAPYAMLAALVPLGLLVWRRNLA